MTWASLVVSILKIALAVLGWIKDYRLIKAGEDKAISAAALKILEETQNGKELREHISALDEPETLFLWDRMLSEK